MAEVLLTESQGSGTRNCQDPGVGNQWLDRLGGGPQQSLARKVLASRAGGHPALGQRRWQVFIQRLQLALMCLPKSLLPDKRPGDELISWEQLTHPRGSYKPIPQRGCHSGPHTGPECLGLSTDSVAGRVDRAMSPQLCMGSQEW